uniref:Uncharacterized protein n=1 Tax=Quercus lobata TaxID=97700 RepID=A0A7N2LKL7_QUELO
MASSHDLSWPGGGGAKSSICTVSFNLINTYLFIDDVELVNLNNLEVLILHGNGLNGSLPVKGKHSIIYFNSKNNFLMVYMANFSSLKILDLSENFFTGSIPPYIGALSSLKALSLYYNNPLNGTLPIREMCALKKLEKLDLGHNNFEGILPPCLTNLTSLRLLDISYNRFSGNLSLSPAASWTSLEYIDLSYNLFEENAGHLLLQGNNLTGSLPKAVLNSSYLVTLDIRDNSFSENTPKEIDRFSNLRVLLLSGNQFSGMIPKELCWLKKIGIMDLSRNFFSGTIPYCFYNVTFGKLAASEFIYKNYDFIRYDDFSFPYKSLLNEDNKIEGTSIYFNILVKIEFLTKYRSNLYQGLILDMMSILDLSFNKLIGEIPPELGRLSSIFALNLSHNQLNSPIPKTFSNLTQLESLDLSHNNLSGEIPSILTDLTFLAAFIVAYNNLSGKVPDMKKQFSTFGESSYEGNPFLCSAPLRKSCTVIDESPPSPQKSSEASDGKWEHTSSTFSFVL